MHFNGNLMQLLLTLPNFIKSWLIQRRILNVLINFSKLIAGSTKHITFVGCFLMGWVSTRVQLRNCQLACALTAQTLSVCTYELPATMRLENLEKQRKIMMLLWI